MGVWGGYAGLGAGWVGGCVGGGGVGGVGGAEEGRADPLGWGRYDGDEVIRGTVWIAGGFDQRSAAEPDLQRIEQMGTDVYATMRSLYLQNRRSEIRGGTQVQLEDLPEFDDAPAEAAPSAADAAKPSAASTPAPYGGADMAAFLAPEERPAREPSAGPPIEL